MYFLFNWHEYLKCSKSTSFFSFVTNWKFWFGQANTQGGNKFVQFWSWNHQSAGFIDYVILLNRVCLICHLRAIFYISSSSHCRQIRASKTYWHRKPQKWLAQTLITLSETCTMLSHEAITHHGLCTSKWWLLNKQKNSDGTHLTSLR
jgi:hypothetical protein